ncbi:alpha-(1,3)-fucosyltransferase 11-like [Centruroides vittatus]|uniref:alpha-(1,3)-fucosyltransferase 11-like n=1 Tax=Centruroides vittatus TaxID=120091 RepID=UPI00350F263C
MRLKFACVVFLFLQTVWCLKPTIVWHTKRLYPHLTDPQNIHCRNVTCISTRKREISGNGKYVAYLFYGTDLEAEDLPLPRSTDDVWALIHEESPMNNYLFSHAAGIKLFNLTSTFRRESDYPLTTQFIPSLEYLTERMPVPLEVKNRLRREGLSPLLYVQSHCSVASDRDRYVKELSNYIPVDSYGSCLNNATLPLDLATTDKYESEKFLNFISKYKFHLAFENAICDDYMTEKLFRALHVGSVPVYKGSSVVRDWMPDENSVVVVDDFDSPVDLANYLVKLDRSDEEYNSFLEFKRTKAVKNEMLRRVIESREWGINDINKIDLFQGFECFVCQKMVDFVINQQKCSTDGDCKKISYVANKNHMGCPQPHPSLEIKLEMNDKWVRESWVDSYWYGLDLAKAIHKMIEAREKKSSRINKYLMSMKYAG